MNTLKEVARSRKKLTVIEMSNLLSVQKLDNDDKGDLVEALEVTTGDAHFTLLTAASIIAGLEDYSDFKEVREELAFLMNETGLVSDHNTDEALLINVEYV